VEQRRHKRSEDDLVLIDRRCYKIILDVRFCRRADSDSDQYLVAEKVRKRLLANKLAELKTDMDSCILKDVSEVETRKKYRIKISNTFAALEN